MTRSDVAYHTKGFNILKNSNCKENLESIQTSELKFQGNKTFSIIGLFYKQTGASI